MCLIDQSINSNQLLQTQIFLETNQEHEEIMLPNTRLFARAFHRVPLAATNKSANAPAASSITKRTFTTTLSAKKWEGSKADAHITNEKDSHNG